VEFKIFKSKIPYCTYYFGVGDECFLISSHRMNIDFYNFSLPELVGVIEVTKKVKFNVIIEGERQ